MKQISENNAEIVTYLFSRKATAPWKSLKAHINNLQYACTLTDACIFTWLVTYHGLCSHSPSVLEVQGGLLNLYLPSIQTKTDTNKHRVTHSSLIRIYINVLCSLRAHLVSCWTWKASVSLKKHQNYTKDDIKTKSN